MAKVTFPIYSTEGLGSELRQGEIVYKLQRYIVDPIARAFTIVTHEYAIIATQDCDLLQDYNQRAERKEGSLCEVLIFPADRAVEAWENIKGSDIKKRILNNKDERYHLFEKVPKELDLMGEGAHALLIDFKRFFTIPPEELYRQINAKTLFRKCRLEMPYREHLQARAGFYFQRIMLPEAHRFDYEVEKLASGTT